MKNNILLCFLSFSLICVFTSCKKDEPKINVVFPDIQYEVDQHIQKYKYMAVVYIDSAVFIRR